MLAEYVKSRSVSNLVVLGHPSRSGSDYYSLVTQLGGREEAVEAVLGVLGVQGLRLTVYLVLGDPGHDPQDLKFNREFATAKFFSIGK